MDVNQRENLEHCANLQLMIRNSATPKNLKEVRKLVKNQDSFNVYLPCVVTFFEDRAAVFLGFLLEADLRTNFK